MSETAINIERIYPESITPHDYVFSTDTVPPRFALVNFGEGTYFWATGPLTEEQLAVSLATSDEESLTLDQQRICNEDGSLGYGVELGDIGYDGEYPGGRDRMALNIARFVLGA